jgi:putative membrane protein
MIKKPMLAIGMVGVFVMVAHAEPMQTSHTITLSQLTPQTQPESPSATKPQTKASQADRKFMEEAILGDMIEVKMGQLAQQKGQIESVKQFGKTLETDHSANEEKAKELAQSMGVTPPTKISKKAEAAYDKLNKLSGANFDRRFAQAMVLDHKKDIAEFQKEAKKSGAVAKFAQETLPTLQKHLQIAEQIVEQTTTTGRGR